ncbi:FAD-dependent oxidoreductase [Veillonella intestinalis]|uniref:FAD-dependent oxidoreductase n=1 Tax=Veillonella intestinalis TaxID=2941341 RepID=UPI00203DCA53|nr:FAD-dependent oxidoreductase [Veillonella intestinalis]
MERFEAIVVGGGLAGAAAAYRMAKAGVKVLLVERGSYGGAKNMTGGRIYTHSLEALIPNFRETAPLERKVTKERISILEGGKATTVEYEATPAKPEDESYVVLRSVFDKWLVDQAAAAGAVVVNRIQVDELLKEGDTVVGIRCGKDTMLADVVVLADGVNSLLAERAGLRAPVTAAEVAVGAKEVYTFNKGVLEERLGLDGNDGLAWLCMGDITHGLMGGGFLYTNKNSLSLGVVVGLEHIGEADATIEDMMNEFMSYGPIARLLKGGKLVERSGHMVPEAGYKAVTTLSGNGFIIVGDAAGFCINMGYTVRGMDFAIASGMYAGDAIIKAKKLQDFSAGALRYYDILIEDSFIGKDLKTYRHFPEFLNNPRIFQKYPSMVNGIMEDVFTVNGNGAKPLVPKLLKRATGVGLVNLAMDALKGGRAL